MKHRLLYIPILLLFVLSFIECAKKGTPSGGKRDSIPPVVVKSSPENYNINFEGKEIRISFDEYIRLKDLQKELIISPPLKNSPSITPLTASKTLKIKIKDTLEENTTYSFNFGNSIVDNNEGNPYPYFKYIFSTGSYIDSLKLSGTVTDAELITPTIPIAVLLYEVDEEFNDSIVFTEKPTYITTTQDSTSTFELTNLKEGKYLLLALEEENNDYTYQWQKDKIGFSPSFITIPNDSSFELKMFKEIPAYKIGRPKHVGKHHITFGYEGRADNLTVEPISDVPLDFESKVYRDFKSDTLHYYFKPKIETDTIIFVTRNEQKIDTLTVRMRDLYQDSLAIDALNPGFLTLKDTLKFKGNSPIVSVDSKKLVVFDKDTLAVAAAIELNSKYNIVNIVFPKKEDDDYTIQLLPGALTDYYARVNDTINVRVKTKSASDYGTLSLALQNVEKFPIIVQLVDERFEVFSEVYLNENAPIFFEYIDPKNYYVRIISDENGNKRWDTGNFLNRLAPEKITYYPSKIEVRANWSLNETFILE